MNANRLWATRPIEWETMDPISSIESETHRRVLEVLARGQADQDAFVETLSPADRVALGELHDWKPKDQIAHNNFWRRDAINRLHAFLEGGPPPDTDDDLAWNDRVFHEQRETPFERLVGETERIRAETGALIQRFSSDDLVQKDRHPWQHGATMELIVLICWYDHPAEHWADVYLSRHEIDRALDLRQAVATTFRDLFPHLTKMYSVELYKLGVYSARGGRSARAISALREALTLNPSLVEQLGQDTDLDPLRALPGFQALFEH
jgi:hypothetical protein